MRARHILIPYKGWWPPDRRRVTLTKEEAYGTAVELRQRLLSGESFPDLARVHSSCPSAEEGGDLGYFLKGDMEPAFEAAVVEVSPGQITQIAHTEHGFHVILRTD